jgi:hypothetical protein
MIFPLAFTAREIVTGLPLNKYCTVYVVPGVNPPKVILPVPLAHAVGFVALLEEIAGVAYTFTVTSALPLSQPVAGFTWLT